MVAIAALEGVVQKWRVAILNEALRLRGTPYGTGSGQIDCSHLVQRCYSRAGLPFPYMQANAFPSSPHFELTDAPQPGDVVYWPGQPHGHIALVVDATRGEFIGAQSSTGVAVANYKANPYWSGLAGRRFFRFRNVPTPLL